MLHLDLYNAVVGTLWLDPSHHSHPNSHLRIWACGMHVMNSSSLWICY